MLALVPSSKRKVILTVKCVVMVGAKRNATRFNGIAQDRFGLVEQARFGPPVLLVQAHAEVELCPQRIFVLWSQHAAQSYDSFSAIGDSLGEISLFPSL
jgi:hypothetical protein